MVGGLYGGYTSKWSYFAYHDSAGGVHPFNGTVTIQYNNGGTGNNCPSSLTPITNAVATDNSSYILNTNGSTATINTSSGLKYTLSQIAVPVVNGSITDANGDTISVNLTSDPHWLIIGKVTDTLDSGGSTTLTIYGYPQTVNCESSPMVYQYTAPNGSLATATVTYKTYTVQTNFNVSIGGVRITNLGPLMSV